MQVLVERRRQDKREAGKALADAWEAEDTCRAQKAELEEKNAALEWWSAHGWKVGVGGTLAVEALGTLIYLLVKGAAAR
jgi:hypothetical protein